MLKLLLFSTVLLFSQLVFSQHQKFINQTLLNSTAAEGDPIVSADGKILFFDSHIKGNRKWAKWKKSEDRYDYDIYYSIKNGEKCGPNSIIFLTHSVFSFQLKMQELRMLVRRFFALQNLSRILSWISSMIPFGMENLLNVVVVPIEIIYSFLMKKCTLRKGFM